MKITSIIGLCLIMALLTCGSASAWLDGYQYRQPITLTGAGSGAQNDYQMNFTVAYDSDMQTDFDDLRFTKLDGDTLLNAWLESKTDGVSAEVYVETDTPADAVEADVYMYYGNATAPSDWDIISVFIPGYDFSTFSGWSGDTTRCTPNQTYQGTPGCLKCNDNSGATSFSITDDVPLPSAFIIECDIAESSDFYSSIQAGNAGNSLRLGWGFRPDYISYLWDGTSKTSTDIDPVITTWYKAKLIAKGGTGNVVDLYVDDVIKLSNQTLTSAPTFLRLEFVGGSGQGDTYYKNLRVSKYVSNPATYEFGSEEERVPPAAPVIAAFNNITGAQSHIPLAHGTTVLFNATAGTEITWVWTLDGVDQSTPYDNYTHTFTSGFGYYAVTVNASNIAGTDTYTWGIWENIETTAETIPTFTDTSYQMLLASIDYPPDMEDFGKALAHPFVQMVGVIFYLFIFGIPLLMMYIRQDNMTLPTTLLLLFGSIIIFMLPPQWQIIAGALMTLGFVGILFKLYKERER